MIEKLIVYPGFNCNMNCLYCHYKNNDRMVLSESKFKKAVKKFLTISEKPELVFLGGEPMLYSKKIFKFISIAKKMDPNLRITAFTNGTIINNQISKAVKEGKIKLILSVDGDKKTNDRMRVFKDGKKSSFKTIIKNIKKYKLTDYITVNMVLNRKTLPSLTDNIRYLYRLGFRSIGWNIDYQDNWQLNDIPVIKSEINKVFIEYLKLIKEKKDIYEISNRYEIIDFIINGIKKECSNLILFPDGNFYPCDKITGANSLKSFIISEKNLEKERKVFFNRMKKKNISSSHLFCQCGIYLFYKYVKNMNSESFEKKIKILFKIQKTLTQIITKQFKILIKYNSFRERHGINYGKKGLLRNTVKL